LALYRARYPRKSPFLIQAQAATDNGFRRSAVTQAERKAAQGRGKVWVYEWDWATPAYDGKFGAVHGIDVSASFHSYRDGFFAGSTEGKRMADRLASAWVAFAKSGDPNNDRLPAWPTYDAQRRAMMVFDNDTRIEDDWRGEIRRYWDANRPAAALG
jgi:para-nitrobenzyl esterase